jgi:hypothetical protein
METNKKNTDKNESTKFAFLPEMVIEHLNHSKPTEFKTSSYDKKNDEISNTTLSQTIIFDPLADPFDGINIEIEPSKKKTKK